MPTGTCLNIDCFTVQIVCLSCLTESILSLHFQNKDWCSFYPKAYLNVISETSSSMHAGKTLSGLCDPPLHPVLLDFSCPSNTLQNKASHPVSIPDLHTWVFLLACFSLLLLRFPIHSYHQVLQYQRISQDLSTADPLFS